MLLLVSISLVLEGPPPRANAIRYPSQATLHDRVVVGNLSLLYLEMRTHV